MKITNKTRTVFGLLVALAAPSWANDSVGGMVKESSNPPPTDSMLQGHVSKEPPAGPPPGPIVIPRSDSIGGAVIEKIRPQQAPPPQFGCVHYAVPREKQGDLGGIVVANNQNVSRLVPKHHDEFVGVVHDPAPEIHIGDFLNALSTGLAITDVIMGAYSPNIGSAPSPGCTPRYSPPRRYGCR